MTEYGRIHTDGSRSGGQPVLLPCPFCGNQPWSYEDANHSTAWEIECGNTTCRAQPSVWNTTKVEAIAAWNTRQPTHHNVVVAAAPADRIGGGGGLPCGVVGVATQSDALQAEIEALRHDLERQMTIANEQVNEVERLREALAHIAFSGADGPYGEFGEALNEHQMRRVAKAALQEKSK